MRPGVARTYTLDRLGVIRPWPYRAADAIDFLAGAPIARCPRCGVRSVTTTALCPWCGATRHRVARLACQRGHLLLGGNVYRRAGRRWCRACRRLAWARQTERRRQRRRRAAA